ncbi:acyltransferase [Pseudomonas silvicola]|nr:acyltransferase [Pseudomonas silvicola]
MERLYSLQGMRGAAVVGVVLFHMASVEAKYSGGDLMLPSVVDFFQLGVDLFFVISGFVMVIVTRGRHQDWVQGQRFVYHRLARIYPNYWLYYAITLAIYLAAPGMVNSAHGGSNLGMSFLLLPSDKVLLVMVAWSLVFELWFYLVFAGLLFVRERWLPVCLGAWALLLVGFNLAAQWQDYSQVVKIILHPYALEFIAGCAIARYFYSPRSASLANRHVWALLLASVLVGMPLIAALGLYRTEGLPRMLLVAAVFSGLTLSLALLERRGLLSVPRWLAHIGDMSYTVYLSHLLVLGVMGQVWRLVGAHPDSLWDNAVFVVLMLTATLCYGWVAYRLIEKPLLDRATAWGNRRFHTAVSRKVYDAA